MVHKGWVINGDMYNTVFRAVKLRGTVVNLHNLARCHIAQVCRHSHCRVKHGSCKQKCGDSAKSLRLGTTNLTQKKSRIKYMFFQNEKKVLLLLLFTNTAENKIFVRNV